MIGQSDVQNWMRLGLADGTGKEYVSMATFENAISKQCMGVQRAVLEGLVQEAADKVALDCPTCKKPLSVVDR